MKFCPQCGQQVPDAARFCRGCGAPVANAQPAAPASEPQESAGERQKERGEKKEAEERTRGTRRVEKEAPVQSPPIRRQAPSTRAQTTPPRENAPSSRITPVERPGLRPPISKAPPAPQPAAPTEEEEEEMPSVPSEGMRFTWQHDAKNGLNPVKDEPHEGTAPDVTSPLVTDSPQPVSLAPPAPGAQTALPPASAPWKFRETTTVWAEKLVAQLRGAAGGKDQPALAAATRMIQGALLHRDIYRNAAQRPELTTEALWVAGTIIAAGILGVLLASGFRFSFSLIWHVALIRIVGWGCALFAIQIAAKSLQQVKIDLPATVWFRGLIYAQAPLLLVAIPGIGSLCALWVGVCTVAAVHDLTGRTTMNAVILTIIGALASTVGVYILTALLR